MPETRAQRTLVKSPPELWAEISDVDALARRLGEFGEIRITRLDPETAVAWEGDRARGTVELEPSGWGTKVTLTARLPDGGEAADPESAADSTSAPQADASPPEGGSEDQAAGESARSPSRRRGFLARLLARRPRRHPGREVEAAQEEPRSEEGPGPAKEAQAAPPPPPAPPEPSLAHGRAEAILTAVLDDLGAAHHRPFSRLA